MEFCSRCRGGEAPNCPVCGGSGFLTDEAAKQPPRPMVGAAASPEVRRRQARSYREAREKEKQRTVRVNSRDDRPRVARPGLSPEEQRDREKWRRKYQKRQQKRASEEKRRRNLTPEQLEKEDRRRREKAYVQRLNRMQVAEKGYERPRRPSRQARPSQPSREEQSAQVARNNQMEEKLAKLLGVSPKSKPPTPGKRKRGKNRSRPAAAHPRPEQPRGGSNRDFPGEPLPPDPLDEVREEFRTAIPSFEREEDASRYMGHSFRDHGEYGSIPMYDDYDES